MPHKIETKEGIIHVVFSGRITTEEVLLLGRELAELEASLDTALGRLTDWSAAESTDLHFRDIEGFARVRRQTKLKNAIRSALVAPTDVHFGLSRIFQALNDNPQITIAVFRDRPSATEWLRSGLAHQPMEGRNNGKV